MEPEPDPASGLTRTPTPHPPSAPSQAADDEYRTCLDREFVQKEIGWARQYGKKIIVIYHEAAAGRPDRRIFGCSSSTCHGLCAHARR